VAKHRSGTDGVNLAQIGDTEFVMIVLHRAGHWLAELLQTFDEALLPLDHDVDAENDADVNAEA